MSCPWNDVMYGAYSIVPWPIHTQSQKASSLEVFMVIWRKACAYAGPARKNYMRYQHRSLCLSNHDLKVIFHHTLNTRLDRLYPMHLRTQLDSLPHRFVICQESRIMMLFCECAIYQMMHIQIVVIIRLMVIVSIYYSRQLPWISHGMATMGWYVDQIVCRVDQKGRNLATYFREEISEPFGK